MYFNQFWSILLSDLIEKGIYYRKKRLKEKVTSSFYMLVCLPWDIWRDLVFVATAFVFKRHLRNLIHRAELTFICWKNSSHIMRNARKTWCECEFFCVHKKWVKKWDFTFKVSKMAFAEENAIQTSYFQGPLASTRSKWAFSHTLLSLGALEKWNRIVKCPWDS